MKQNTLWYVAALAAFALCCSLNAGYAWMGDPAKEYHLAVTVGYVLSWSVLTVMAKSRQKLRLCANMAGLTLLAAVLGLLARAAAGDSPWMIPALVLTPFSTVPFYGLRLFLDWTGMELVSVILSSFWLVSSLIRLHKNPSA